MRLSLGSNAAALTAVIVLLFLPVADGAGQSESEGEVLKNTDIIDLHELGLGPELLVQKIQTSRADFDLSVKGLKQLKEADIPDAVISEMLTSASAPMKAIDLPEGEASADLAGSDSTPAEPGIYVSRGGELSKLEPSVARGKTSMASAFTFGIKKSKLKAVLSGMRAERVLGERDPVFYFYFGDPNLGRNNILDAASPNEYSLVKLKLENGTREVVLAEGRIGVDVGIPEEYDRPIDYEQLGLGYYKVTPRVQLDDGEYCFLRGEVDVMKVGNLQAFDFGVRQGQDR